eukprot:1141043-Rhodomonas_salina.4
MDVHPPSGRCGIRNSHASSAFVKTKFEEVKKEKFVAGALSFFLYPSYAVTLSQRALHARGSRIASITLARAYMLTARCCDA